MGKPLSVSGETWFEARFASSSCVTQDGPFSLPDLNYLLCSVSKLDKTGGFLIIIF